MSKKLSFDEILEKKETNSDSLSNEAKLEFYKYFKQATIGNVNIERPWSIYIKDVAKWDAWNSVKDISNEKAKELYVETYYKYLIS
jgi:diazepam-binding inhibitor (GABA receptor modulator, acyl-CoA-binding protein)